MPEEIIARPGRKFEDDVAELYSLLGATVVQDVEVCNKQVDILATFFVPGSSTGHRVIVECKDEAKSPAQNQRVLQLSGLLKVARQAGLADSGEVITRVPWGPLARAAALEAAIPLNTYREKVSKLIDFKRYLTDVVTEFKEGNPQRPTEPALAKYYVEPRVQLRVIGSHGPVDLKEHVRKWLQKKDAGYQLAILSGYGTGKTSFCHDLAARMAREYLDNPGGSSARIPILLDLAEFTKTLRIESLITSFLDDRCSVSNPRYTLFRRMNEAGLLFLILDGFDEMATRVDGDSLEVNVVEIEKLLAGGEAKGLITSREEYFTSVQEQERIFRPRGVKARGADFRGIQYEGLQILLWTPSQVSQFLSKRVPLIPGTKKAWTYYRDQIESISGLRDLARRPILLELIVRTLPELVKSGKPINRPNLYETYLSGEIRRQKVQKGRRLLIGDEDRFQLLEDVAVGVVSRGLEGITLADARARISERMPRLPDTELEAHVREFLTCSFLIKPGDEFRFSHQSITEYLGARGLWRQASQDNLEGWAQRSFGEGVRQFMQELNPSAETMLAKLVQRSRAWANADVIAGNAATLLARMAPRQFRELPLRDVLWTGADLGGANLKGVDLRGSFLKGCSIAGAVFSRKDLEAIAYSQLRMAFVLVVAAKSASEAKGVFEAVVGKMRFSGVNVVSKIVPDDALDGHAVGRFTVRVADKERLTWVEQALARQRTVRWKVLCSDELERLVSGCPSKIVPALRKAYAQIDPG